MASKRKQEEKHLALLREMVSKEHNKTCFDCHQRGPTYVNMTVGSFVCTSCSGILRGLNPPNRVKSISMASYSPTEIEFLQKHGNEICRTVWLGLYDAKSRAGPESRDEHKVRDFMIQKYEKKRWYVEPSQAAAVAKAKADSTADKSSVHSSSGTSSGTPEPRPLRTLVGDNAAVPNLVVGRTSSTGSRGVVQGTPPVTPPNSKANKKPTVDLLGDLGGSDPFAAAPAPGAAIAASQSAQQQQVAQGGFADFSQAFGNQPSFGNQASNQAAPAASAAAAPAPAAFQPFGAAPASSAQSNDFGAFTSSTTTPATMNQTTANLQNLSLGGGAAPAPGTGAGDRYAALTELSTLGTGIDWAGGGLSSSTSVDWSGGSKISGSAAIGSSGNSSGFEWGGQAPAKPAGANAAAAGSTMFGSTSMPNMAAATGGGTPAQQGMMAGGMMGQAGVITTQAAMPGFGTTPFSSAGAPASNPFMGATTQASNPFMSNAPATSTALPQSNGMFGAHSGQFAVAQPSTSVSFGSNMQPPATSVYGGVPGGQMNGGHAFGQMPQQQPQGQFAAAQQQPAGSGQFAAQAHFPAVQGQQHAQFPTPGQQAQFPSANQQGQFNMQPQQGQFPPTQGAPVGVQPGTGQMPAGFGMQQPQQQQQPLTFGGASMAGMAGMQFNKMAPQPQQPQQAGMQLGGIQQGGFGGIPNSQQQQQQSFSASWGATTQQQQPAMTSNPFMASGFGPQAQLPPKAGSSNPFL